MAVPSLVVIGGDGGDQCSGPGSFSAAVQSPPRTLEATVPDLSWRKDPSKRLRSQRAPSRQSISKGEH